MHEVHGHKYIHCPALSPTSQPHHVVIIVDVLIFHVSQL
jgi:hypothetical protein